MGCIDIFDAADRKNAFRIARVFSFFPMRRHERMSNEHVADVFVHRSGNVACNQLKRIVKGFDRFVVIQEADSAEIEIRNGIKMYRSEFIFENNGLKLFVQLTCNVEPFFLHESAAKFKAAGAVVVASDGNDGNVERSEEHTSELQSRENLVCRLLLEKKKN